MDVALPSKTTLKKFMLVYLFKGWHSLNLFILQDRERKGTRSSKKKEKNMRTCKKHFKKFLKRYY
jgi:hypothetical protein